MLNEDQIPEGYMQNAQGCLVPRANIRPIDIERDALVKEKMKKLIDEQNIIEKKIDRLLAR